MCIQSVSLHVNDRKLVRTINLIKYLRVAYNWQQLDNTYQTELAIVPFHDCVSVCAAGGGRTLDSLLTLLRPLTFPSAPAKTPPRAVLSRGCDLCTRAAKQTCL